MLADKDFRLLLTRERQRSERSRKSFLLMLLDAGDSTPSEKNRKLLEKILASLAGSIRASDVAGWYRNNSALGVIFTEIEPDDRNRIPITMMTRLSEALRKNLSQQQFSQVGISVHVFPEQWNHDIPQSPTDPIAPVYAPRKPRPRLRSGGATAVPEPDDKEEVSPDNSFSRVAPLSIEDSSDPRPRR